MAGQGQNALTQPRSMAEPRQAWGGVTSTMMDAARQMGYQGEDPQEAAVMLWEASPTDQIGELIDQVSRETGIMPPWGQQGDTGGPGAAGMGPAPQQPMHDDRADHRSMTPSYGDRRRGGY